MPLIKESGNVISEEYHNHVFFIVHRIVWICMIYAAGTKCSIKPMSVYCEQKKKSNNTNYLIETMAVAREMRLWKLNFQVTLLLGFFFFFYNIKAVNFFLFFQYFSCGFQKCDFALKFNSNEFYVFGFWQFWIDTI